MKIIYLILSFLLFGCGQIHVNDYENNEPKLILEEFFEGKLTASGILKDSKGLVTRYFNVKIQASWKDGVGTLDEDFIFDDGEQQKRIWTLKKISENKYEASAGDIKHKTIIDVSGNSMFMEYILIVPYKDSTIDITIDDRMYLVNKNTLINESSMTKFGFNVGEINLVIQHANYK